MCCILSCVFMNKRGTRIYKNISLILFSRGAPSLLSSSRNQGRRWSAAYPFDRLSILWILSKSDRVVLISRSLLPVTHLLYRPAPTHCHPCVLITASQSTRGHLERTENPCHMLYNKCIGCVLFCKELTDCQINYYDLQLYAVRKCIFAINSEE